jgi:hypothetical protein
VKGSPETLYLAIITAALRVFETGINVQGLEAHESSISEPQLVLKQIEFGITPVTVPGGTVKVNDEVKVEFDIALMKLFTRRRAEDRRESARKILEDRSIWATACRLIWLIWLILHQGAR